MADRTSLERQLEELNGLKLRGKITDEEYEARRDALMANRSIPALTQRRGLGWLPLLAIAGVFAFIILVTVIYAVATGGDPEDEPVQVIPATPTAPP